MEICIYKEDTHLQITSYIIKLNDSYDIRSATQIIFLIDSF